MLQQGLVLLVAGMGIAISFLLILAVVTLAMSKVIPHINLFPEPEPKKAPAKAPASDDTAVAIAIAVAAQR